MSTCLKVIFKQVEGGMEVRTGYDATSKVYINYEDFAYRGI